MKVKVLFVCLGNICRSPVAEGLMKHKVEKNGLSDHIEVDSSGTGAYHIGEQPDRRSAANARDNGVELNHQARQFTADDFQAFDYIITMDNSNFQNVKRLDPANEFENKLFMMRDFDPLEKGSDVPDPYFGGDQGFQHVFDILDRSTDQLIEHLLEQHKLRGN